MFSAFFGNYILNKGLVSAEDLSSVLKNQKEVRLKLGVLAINSGFMNATQVQEIHELQALKDKRFGELAIEKNYLSQEQLDLILQQQKSEHLILAQALIDENLMSMSTFEKELLEYKAAHSLTDEQFDALKDGNVDIVVNAFLSFDDTELAHVYREYVSLIFKNIIRFIDSDVRIEEAQTITSMQSPFMFTQKITGEMEMITSIAGDSETLIAFAGKYADEAFTEMDDYAKDSIGEFLNLHNGLFTVNMSNIGVELDLTVQTNQENATLKADKIFYRIPFYLSFGEFDLVLGL
ncbi:MAG: hypothetical protein CVU84_15080 [Firmicutes bacterium HGW-Firmicutes-1]|jgi:CheY-specific phosphatase CheX|nr:MAG: hypothetical protein CVU84_15080 [Firmicutes bacterium HGW-Firmicutes-1]